MINNVIELKENLVIETNKALSKYSAYDLPIARFSIGYIINKQNVYSPSNEDNIDDATSIIISASCDNTDSLDSMTTLDFPFSESALDELTEQIIRSNLNGLLLERFGDYSETGTTYILEWLENEKFCNALIYNDEFERLPESLDECHHTPEYDKEKWLNNYTGSGISIDNAGIWGIFSNYDQCDWDLDHNSLLHEDTAVEFKKNLNDLCKPFDYTEYAQWVMDNGRDPLDRYRDGNEHPQLRMSFHIVNTNNTLKLESINFWNNKSNGLTPRLNKAIQDECFYNNDYLIELIGHEFELIEGCEKRKKLHERVQFLKLEADELIDSLEIKEGNRETIDITKRIDLPKQITRKRLIEAAKKDYFSLKVDLNFEDVTFLIAEERANQKALAFDGDTDNFDKSLNANDWIALSISYLGRATQKSFRNARENQSYRDNIIKAITLLYSSLESQGSALSNSDTSNFNKDNK